MGMKRPSNSLAQNSLAYKPPLAAWQFCWKRLRIAWAVITAIMIAAASAVR